MEANCKNCHLALHPDFAHCPGCGQKTQLHRLSMHDVFHEAVHYFTHADKGLFTLIRDLVVKRGTVAREFVEGKRKKYFSPLTFFLLTATIYVFVSNISPDRKLTQQELLEQNPWVTEYKDAEKRAAALEMAQRKEEGQAFIRQHANTIALATVPITAFLFWLFYCRGRYNYTEHFVAALYMTGILTMLFTVLLLLGRLLRIDINWIHLVMFFTKIFYYANFYYLFMGDFRARKAWKAFGVSLVAMFWLYFLSGLVMWLYMAKVFG